MNKSKAFARAIPFFSILIFLGFTIWTVSKVGLISEIGQEDIYWERARFLLGQGGASLYSGSSLCSLGYSFVLLPFVALISSPYAAYKAAILLNGLFISGSYVAALTVAKRVFTGEHETFLSFACFVALFCPAMGSSTLYSGPGAFVMFLCWMSILIVLLFEKQCQKKYLWMLAFCLILIGFLQISAIGILIGFAVLPGMILRKKQRDETPFFTFLLVLFLGLSAGIFTERVVLNAFAENTDLVVYTSFQVFLSGISTGWKNGTFFGLFTAVVGKFCIVLTESCLLICPALWSFCRNIRIRDKQDSSVDARFINIGILNFIVQLLLIALYENSYHSSEQLLSVSDMEMTISFAVLIGVVCLKKSQKSVREILGYLVFYGIVVFFAAEIFQQAASELYLKAGTIMLVSVLAGCFFSVNVFGRKINGVIKVLACVGLCSFFLYAHVFGTMRTAAKKTEEGIQRLGSIASLLSEMETDSVYGYLCGSGNDQSIVVLQSLMPRKEIKQIEKNRGQWKEFLYEDGVQKENVILITGIGQDEIDAVFAGEPTDYRILYTSGEYALWAQNGSMVSEELKKRISDRMEYLKLVRTEETEGIESKIYAENLSLASGSYRLELYLNGNNIPEDVQGQIIVSGEDGVICSQSISSSIFDEAGHGAVSLEFSNRELLRDVEIKMEGSVFNYASIEQVYYWKKDSAYMVGLNNIDAVRKTADIILKMKDKDNAIGSIAFVDGEANEANEISLLCFQEALPEYELYVASKDEIDQVDAEYLIAETASHAYFEAMDAYSMLSRGSVYTILVRNDSDQYKQYLTENGYLLSSGKEILLEAISAKAAKGGSFSLEAGTYCYHVLVQADRKTKDTSFSGCAATLYLYTEDNILASREITYGDLFENQTGTVEILIPLTLRSNTKRIRCRIEGPYAEALTIQPKTIELKAEKYQYGREEEELPKLVSFINDLGEDVPVTVVQNQNELQQTDYSFLAECLKNVDLQALSYETLTDSHSDTFLLTYGFSKKEMNLLNQYSILGHAGKYTLWVRSEGEWIQEAMQAGKIIFSSGKKISPFSIALMRGSNEQENVIEYLPNGQYTIYVKLDTSELTADDTVEVRVLCDKKKSEMSEEIEDMCEEGYTDTQAEQKLVRQKECAKGFYDVYSLQQTNGEIVALRTIKRQMNNLTSEAYSLSGSPVDCKIIWIELA